MIEISPLPIDTQKIIDSVASQNAGAINVFIGTVRNSGPGLDVEIMVEAAI